jgi:hypothetical protein
LKKNKKEKEKKGGIMERFTTYFLCSLVEREKELVRAEEVGHTATTMEHRL